MDQAFLPSVLDRLSSLQASADLNLIQEQVRRDLEDLLNSQQGRDDIPSHFKELKNSLVRYGIQGFNRTNLESFEERNRLIANIKRVIGIFEPRLENVEVNEIMEETEGDGLTPFTLRLQIRGDLRVGKDLLYVIFGTQLNRNGASSVKLG